jgi:hypothetical protein
VSDPPAIYQAAFSVGATSATTDTIASFSSRGPVTVDGSNRPKPNISAPGVNTRSSVPGGGYASFSGTSMAGPHVVGVVALLLSANPSLKGQVGAVETTLQATAVPRTIAQTCGGVPGTAIPNNTYGYGRIDAFATAHDLVLSSPAWPATVVTGQPLPYTLTLANGSAGGAAIGVRLIQRLPSAVTVDSVTPSQGTCAITAPDPQDNSGALQRTIICDLGALALAASATVQISITPTVLGTATSRATAAANGFDLVPASNLVDFQTLVQASVRPRPVPRPRSTISR